MLLSAEIDGVACPPSVGKNMRLRTKTVINVVVVFNPDFFCPSSQSSPLPLSHM
jgi:hypothetical protein